MIWVHAIAALTVAGLLLFTWLRIRRRGRRP